MEHCKTGDTVYLLSKDSGEMIEGIVTDTRGEPGKDFEFIVHAPEVGATCTCKESDIGKEVFLDKYEIGEKVIERISGKTRTVTDIIVTLHMKSGKVEYGVELDGCTLYFKLGFIRKAEGEEK